MPGQQIKALTGIRGFLALWVFAIHAGIFLVNLPFLHSPLIKSGYMGVDGFFILSGLVLFHVHGEEMKQFRWRQTGDFLVLRLARIYPLHVFIFLLFFVYVGGLLLAGRPTSPGQYSWQAAIAHLTLTQAWFGNHLFIQTWNAPAWTISAEWTAYLVFPVLAIAAARLRPQLFVAGSLAILIVFELAYGLSQPNNVVRILPEFMLGMSLARLPLLPRLAADVLSIAAVVLIVTAIWFGNLLLPVLGLAGLVYSLRTEKTLLARLMSARISLWLGEISYSIYMCHMFVLMMAHLVLADRLPDVAALAVDLGLTLGIATACYLRIEVPCRRWIRNLRFTPRRGVRPHTSIAASAGR